MIFRKTKKVMENSPEIRHGLQNIAKAQIHDHIQLTMNNSQYDNQLQNYFF